MSYLLNVNILMGAMLVEAAVGYPTSVFRAIRHPVVWIGELLSKLELRLNHNKDEPPVRRRNGIVALTTLVAVVVGIASVVQAVVLSVLPHALGLVLIAILASSLLAQRSLWTHVIAVASGLEHAGVAGGREAVAHIVGRNVQGLDEPAVVRAAIESLAESFSDGVVAPAFWCGLLGLPGIAAYKAINTADSMIGHLTPRHQEFGLATARLDDWVNLPGSRLAAVWICAAAFLLPDAQAGRAVKTTLGDACRHRSPNAGWPEAAMAGALGVRLAGPRVYGTTRVEEAFMGNGRLEATVGDLRRALRIYAFACAIQLAVVVLLAIILQA